MDVSSLGNFTAGQKQTSEASPAEGSKSARLAATSSEPQATEEAQTSPIPPVNQTGELSGEEGNSVSSESGSGGAVDLLA